MRYCKTTNKQTNIHKLYAFLFHRMAKVQYIIVYCPRFSAMYLSVLEFFMQEKVFTIPKDSIFKYYSDKHRPRQLLPHWNETVSWEAKYELPTGIYKH